MTGRHVPPTAQMPQSAADRPTVDSSDHSSRVNSQATREQRLDLAAFANGLGLGLLAVMVGGLLYFQLAHRTAYEYKTVSPGDYLFDQEMNRLGSEGWKIESCRRATSSSGYSASYECIMSRPKLGW